MSNQCIIDNNKVFLGDDRINNFERELFVSQFLSDKSAQLISATTGQFNAETTLLERLKREPFCGPRITNQDPPVPVITMPVVDEKTISLAAWLQEPKNQKSIPKEVVSTFAFQLILLVGKLQSQYGIIHNNISEKTILVKEITTPKLLRLACENDIFEVQLDVGHLEVFIGNFDFALLKKTSKYESNPNPWEMLPSNMPQTNNCPEAFFGENYKKTSDCDLFMIGHVLLTMHLHGNYQNFVYNSTFGGIHVYDIRRSYDAVFPTSELVRDIYGKFPNDDIVFTSFDVKTPEAIEMLLLNLFAVNVAIQGNAVAVQVPEYVSDNAKKWYENVRKPGAVQNYVFNRFTNLLDKCGDKSSQSLIQRLMDFNPDTRKGVSNYALVGYLFHPYFAGFYKGYTTSLSPTSLDDVLDFFAPPLEYSTTFIEGASWGFIQQRITDFEVSFKKDLESQKQGWKKVVEDTKAKKQADDEAKEKRRLEVEERKRLEREKKRLEEEEAKKKKQLEEEAEKAKPVEQPKVSTEKCLEFVKVLQDRKWTFDVNPLLVKDDETGQRIVSNTKDCIQTIIGLAKGDEKKLQILEAAKITKKDSSKKYVARDVILINTEDETKRNEFIYLQDDDYDGRAFNLTQAAKNGAYLTVGIYAMTNNLSREQVLAFVQDIDSIDEGSTTSDVQAMQEKTAELQGGTYVFKLPSQENLTDPGIVDKTVNKGIIEELSKETQRMIMMVYNTTKSRQEEVDVFAAVEKEVTQEAVNILHQISKIHQNSPSELKPLFENYEFWEMISAENRLKESFYWSTDKVNYHLNVAKDSVADDEFLRTYYYDFEAPNGKHIVDYTGAGGVLQTFLIVINFCGHVLREMTNRKPTKDVLKTWDDLGKEITPDNLIQYLLAVMNELKEIKKTVL
jgi:hypothetical protein